MKRDRRFKKNNVIIIYIDFKNNNKQSYTQNSIEFSYDYLIVVLLSDFFFFKSTIYNVKCDGSPQ